MKKMSCLFKREFHSRDDFTIHPIIEKGCEWVVTIPRSHLQVSRKYDGTACAVIGGELYKRYDAKKGKTPPEGAVPCQPEPDPVTGHWPHWVKVVVSDPASKWHWEAWEREGGLSGAGLFKDGTYELCGPHFSANPERYEEDTFVLHGNWQVTGNWPMLEGGGSLSAVARTLFDKCDLLLKSVPFEGLVFLNEKTGERCKIRRADFGHVWPMSKEELYRMTVE